MDSHDVNDTGRSARCRLWLGVIALAVAGGCESAPDDPYGYQGAAVRHGHSVGQRQGEGPAIGSDPTVSGDLEFFGGSGVQRH